MHYPTYKKNIKTVKSLPKTWLTPTTAANHGMDASNESNTSNTYKTSDKPSGVPAKTKKKPTKKKNGVVKYDPTCVLEAMYIDADPKVAKGPGGAKTDPLLDLVLAHVYLKSNLNGKLLVCCAGATYGCTHNWATPRWKTCIFKHTVGCSKLDSIDPTLHNRV